MLILIILSFYGVILVEERLLELLVVVVSFHHLLQFGANLGLIAFVRHIDVSNGLHLRNIAVEFS